MGLFAKVRTQIRNERLKKHKGNNTKVKSAQNKKRASSSVGNIYVVHPSHVVESKQMNRYVKSKSGRVTKRPVAVVRVKKNKDVAIAQLFGNPGKKPGARVPLAQTKTKKRSWLGTEEKNQSEKTTRQFRIGESPLNTKRKGKVHSNDLKRRDKAIKKVT